MLRQLEIPARLILHWTALLLEERQGTLETLQRSDTEEIGQAAQKLLYITRTFEKILGVVSDSDTTPLGTDVLEVIHDISTSLNTIRGFSSVFISKLNGSLNAYQEHQFVKINRAAKLALNWLDGRFSSTRINNGPISSILRFDFFSLSDLLLKTQENARKLVEGKPIEVIYQIEEDLPQAFGDEFRVRQIILLLLSNAAKLTDSGSIKVNAKSVYPMSKRCYLQVTIADTGRTLTEQDVVQLNSTDLPRQSEIGFNIFLSRSLVKLMGGRLWLERRLDGGIITHVHFCTISSQVRHTSHYSIPRRMLPAYPRYKV